MYIFGCGVVFGSHGGCLFRFVLNLLFILNMCVCPESLRCAACSASLGPLAFDGVLT